MVATEKIAKKKKWTIKKIILLVAGTILALIIIAFVVQLGTGGRYQNDDGSYTYISKSNSFNHVYNHPIWENSGKDLFSVWEDQNVENLTGILSLQSIYYWCGWDIDTVVDAVNYLIEQANNEKISIYTVYKETEIANDEHLSKVQLVFYKGDANKPFALVAAGGGYQAVRSETEGYPYAKVLHEQGYNVFVLRYRVGDEAGEAEDTDMRVVGANDLAQAVSYIKENADSIGVTMEGYSLWGSSAGGGIETLFSFECNKEKNTTYHYYDLPAPSSVVLIYTDRFLMDQMTFSKNDPHVFAIMGIGDEYGGDECLDKKIPEMEEAGMIVEYHKIDGYPHGVGLGIGTPAEGWIEKAISFWQEQV